MGILGMVYMLIHLTAHQGEVMLVRRYGKKYGAGGMLFNGVICLFAMIYFVLTDWDGFHFLPELWVYGIINALLYAAGFYYAYVAYGIGNYFLTNTITSMQFMIPIIYGLVFLKEPSNWLTYSSLVFSIASVILMCYARKQKADQSEEGNSISAKWLFATLITLFSNGLISVVAKMQQIRFDKQHSNEYMVITLAGAFLFLLLMGVVLERNGIKKTLKQGIAYGIGAGMLNGLKNGINLALIALVPLSVLTPVKKGGGIVFTFLVSYFLYKERYTKLQYLSILLSIIAIVLMQLS